MLLNRFNMSVRKLSKPEVFKLIRFLNTMIVKCTNGDLPKIYEIVNDAASAYKGIIPADCYHDPYMSLDDLTDQIGQGVTFWCYKENTTIVGVMGIQERGDVTLIRHAYVRTVARGKGIGSKLLHHLSEMAEKPVLIGTWADANWAISFYQKHGFRLLGETEKDYLLSKYWTIPTRQKETSVVLANADWKG